MNAVAGGLEFSVVAMLEAQRARATLQVCNVAPRCICLLTICPDCPLTMNTLGISSCVSMRTPQPALGASASALAQHSAHPSPPFSHDTAPAENPVRSLLRWVSLFVSVYTKSVIVIVDRKCHGRIACAAPFNDCIPWKNHKVR